MELYALAASERHGVDVFQRFARRRAGGRHGHEHIERAYHPSADLERMGVDHGGAHVRVAQQFLHRADVGATLQEVGGETVAQRVRAGRLGHARMAQGFRESAAEGLQVQVVLAQAAPAPWRGSVLRLAIGNTQNHAHDSPARGYLAARACGR